jgi:tetratricopeptide (TPR) repeat protein
MRSTLIGIALAGLLFAVPALAQQKGQNQNPPPKSSGESSSTPNGPPAPPAADSATTYDPVSAEEDVEVGTFYMHKGDYDAAISRFQDAIRLRSNFAKPRLLAAEAYEKKGDKAGAVKCYKDYLQAFPHASDAKKIQNKIDKLSGE